MDAKEKFALFVVSIIVVGYVAGVVGVDIGEGKSKNESEEIKQAIPWYDKLVEYAESQGKTVDELVANWTAEDWWDWYKYEGSPHWGSTVATDTSVSTDWIHLSNIGNITWGADEDIQAWFNATSGMLEWKGVVDNLSINNLQSEASYIIWTDGTYYYAMNGATELIEFKSTNASWVIQNCLDALTNSGRILIKKGTYELNFISAFYIGNSKYCLSIDNDNIEIIGEKGATLKVKDGVDIGGTNSDTDFLVMIRVNASNIKISGLIFDGNYANINVGQVIPIWHGGDKVEVAGNIFKNFYKWAIWGDGEGKRWNIHDNLIYGPYNGIALHNAGLNSMIHNNIIGVESYCITGIMIDSVENVHIYNNIIRRPSINGIYLYDAVSYCKIHDNIILGKSGTGTGKGIKIQSKESSESVCKYNEIKNNYFRGVYTSQLDIGVYISDSYVENTIIENNIFVDIPTPISDFGTNTKIADNYGYTTENSGLAEIVGDNSNTTFYIAHGLAGTPTWVSITPTNTSMASATWFWNQSATNETVFAITFTTAPASGEKLSLMDFKCIRIDRKQ